MSEEAPQPAPSQSWWAKTAMICSGAREGVVTMWFLGRTLRGIWEDSQSPQTIQRNSEDHNTKLTVYLCCASLAVLGEVFGSPRKISE